MTDWESRDLSTSTWRQEALFALRRFVPLLAALALLFVAGILLNIPEVAGRGNPFLKVANQRNVLQQVSVNGILAVGMTLVILTAGIDLSVGSLLSLGSVVCAMLLMERPDADYEVLSRAHAVMLPAVMIFAGLIGYALIRRLWRGCGGWAWPVALLVALVAGWLAWGMPFGRSPAATLGTLGVLIVVPLVGGLFGMINGIVIAKTRLQPFIVTLAMMISAVGLAKFIAGQGGRVHSIYMAGPQQVGAPASFDTLGEPILTVGQETLRSGQVRDVKLIPIPGLFMLGCWSIAAVLLHRYPLGRYIYAVGGNEETARLAGLPVDRVKIFVYTASGLLSGLAAVLFCAQYKQGVATAGQMKELDAIAAVVIGGTSLMGGRGSIVGTLVGVMIFGYLANILALRGVSSEIQDIVKGVIIVGAAALQSGHVADNLRAWWRRMRLRGHGAGE